MKYQAVKLDDGTFGVYDTVEKKLMEVFVPPGSRSGEALVEFTPNKHCARNMAATMEDEILMIKAQAVQAKRKRTPVAGIKVDAPIPTNAEVDDLEDVEAAADVEDESSPLPDEEAVDNDKEFDGDDGFDEDEMDESVPPPAAARSHKKKTASKKNVTKKAAPPLKNPDSAPSSS